MQERWADALACLAGLWVASSRWNDSVKSSCRWWRRNTNNLARRIFWTICSSCAESATEGCQWNGCIFSPLVSQLFQTYSCKTTRLSEFTFPYVGSRCCPGLTADTQPYDAGQEWSIPMTEKSRQPSRENVWGDHISFRIAGTPAFLPESRGRGS